MDKEKLREFINAMGMLAEASLLFYRNLINAGANNEEAFRLTSERTATS